MLAAVEGNWSRHAELRTGTGAIISMLRSQWAPLTCATVSLVRKPKKTNMPRPMTTSTTTATKIQLILPPPLAAAGAGPDCDSADRGLASGAPQREQVLALAGFIMPHEAHLTSLGALGSKAPTT